MIYTTQLHMRSKLMYTNFTGLPDWLKLEKKLDGKYKASTKRVQSKYKASTKQVLSKY